MNTKQLFITTFFLLAVFIARAQTGIIKGTVFTSDGKPAELVNVVVEKTGRGTTVNKAGAFIISNIQPGSYTLTASFTGLRQQKKEVTVIAGQTVVVDFILEENSTQLKEVEVMSANKIADKTSDFVARMPLKNLENPQVYSVVGKELMKEQMMIDIKEPFLNSPGVVPAQYVTGMFNVLFRGFTTWDYARNGMATSVERTGTEIVNLERIEMIKGPSGTLFGGSVSSFGGVMNLVTKKPYAHFGGEVDYSIGSFDLSRATVDINAPLNKDKTVLFRINAVQHRQNSVNEFGKSKRLAVAPSLSYQVNDRLSLLFDFEYYKSNATQLPYSLLFADETPFNSFKDIPLDFKKSFFQNDLLSQTEAFKYFLHAKYQLSKNWTSTTDYSNVNEYVTSSYQPYITWFDEETAAPYVQLFGPRERTSTNFQQNFNGSFSTGSIHHKLLLGVSYEYISESYSLRRTANLDTISVKDPFDRVGKEIVDQALIHPSFASSDAYSQNVVAVYASDVISWTDRFSTMLSLRLNRYEDKYGDGFKQTSLSPKLGVVYQVVKDKVSVFANYMNGFQNQGPIAQPDATIFKPKPVFANQWEGGVKAELPGNKLSATLSYYYIGIDNAIRTDENQFTIQNGKQVSKGMEAELIVNPVSGLNIITGYAFNENKIVRADDYEGKLVTGAPQHVVNYWISYKLPLKSVKGIGIGFGGNYVGDSYFNSSNTLVLPANHVINATAFYEKDKWRIGFKINNISDVQYWDPSGFAQTTRNFIANFSFRF